MLTKAGIFLFKAVCFVLAGYMTIQLVDRFVKNLDVSTIEFKPFDSTSVEEYPSFTFCLEDRQYGNTYKWSYFETDKGITASEYQDVLRGNAENSTWLSQITFDDATKTPNDWADLFWDFETKIRNGTVFT